VKILVKYFVSFDVCSIDRGYRRFNIDSIFCLLVNGNVSNRGEQ
jgi:hypothetical protein